LPVEGKPPTFSVGIYIDSMGGSMRLRKLAPALLLLAAISFQGYAAAMTMACGVGGVTDYGDVHPFKDLMKSCRVWEVIDASSGWDYPHLHLGQGASDISTVAFRADGYPTKIPYNGKKVVSVMQGPLNYGVEGKQSDTARIIAKPPNSAG